MLRDFKWLSIVNACVIRTRRTPDTPLTGLGVFFPLSQKRLPYKHKVDEGGIYYWNFTHRVKAVYLLTNFLRSFVIAIQQILTSYISGLKSVIIGVNLMLWSQNRMSQMQKEPASISQCWTKSHYPFSYEGSLRSLLYAVGAWLAGLHHWLHLWAAHQHWSERSFPSSSLRAHHSQIGTDGICEKNRIKDRK